MKKKFNNYQKKFKLNINFKQKTKNLNLQNIKNKLNNCNLKFTQQILNQKLHIKIWYKPLININFIHLNWMIGNKNLKIFKKNLINYLKRIQK